MVQVAKPEVRQAFVAAAAATFADLGYAATTMADVATRAGSSVGNLYKYFNGKEQLFDAAVAPELAAELMRRTRARMRALGAVKDIRELGASAEYHALAGDLLDYCLEHRAAVVVLLSRAEGTALSSFKHDFVAKLVQWSLDYARVAYPDLQRSPELLFALQHAYTSFVSTVAQALRQFPDDAQVRAVIALVTAQHQGGLKRLFEAQGETDAQSRNAPTSSVVPPAARPRARNTRAVGASSSAAGAGAGQADRPRRPRRRG